MAGNVLKAIARYAGFVWALCKTRKSHKCYLCRGDMMKGTMVYRPITNGYDRPKRMCIHCMEASADELR